MNPIDLDRAQLVAAERLEGARGDIESLKASLARAPRWRPARGLIAQCDEAMALIERMRQRMKRKLIVALVGPTGAGKSTLLNALAGIDGLSHSGVDRPTTREVVVFCRDTEDATPLVERLGHRQVDIVSSPAAVGLEHVVLVDTPDINSSQLAQHRPIVEGVIGVADVLVCVFNVENPKSKDNAEFLAPFVAAFPSRFVFAVLNHCDRQDQAELQADIRPDFERHLKTAWDRAPAGLFCISARANLQRPDWPAGAAPRHDFDEFGLLRQTLFGSLNRASVVLDARIERAGHLVAAVRQSTRDRAKPARDALTSAAKGITKLHAEALTSAAGALGDASSSLGTGTNALYYQRLANAWWGPVGWLVGFWARFLILGAGFANVLRFGRPLRQLWGVITGLARFKQSKGAIEDTKAGFGAEVAALRYRDRYEKAWPDLAESLVSAGFDPAIRETVTVLPDAEALDEVLARQWSSALSDQLERATTRLSGWWLQVFLNAWVLVPGFYVAAECVIAFASGRLLSGDYFRHAFLTIFLLWVLAFFVFQMLAKIFGGRRLLAATFRGLIASLRDGPQTLNDVALSAEVDAVRQLGRL